jgi:hypothetical protein
MRLICTIAILGLIACSGRTAPTFPSPTPSALTPATPYPTSTPYPTYTLYPTSTPYPTFAMLPSSTNVQEGIRLVVRAIHEGPPAYDRRECRQWIDADRDCQNTRAEVLIEESIAALTFKDARQCLVISGEWLAEFTGATVTQASGLDIDHMVPMAPRAAAGCSPICIRQKMASRME